MSSKVWVSTFLLSIMVFFTILITFNYYVDPTGRWGNVLNIPVRPIKGLGKNKQLKIVAFYQSNAPIIILGSSRVFSLNFPETINGEKVYNLALFAAHIKKISEIGIEAIEHGEISKIYIGLDYFGFNRKDVLEEDSRQSNIDLFVDIIHSLINVQSTGHSLRIMSSYFVVKDKSNQINYRTGMVKTGDMKHSRKNDLATFNRYQKFLSQTDGLLKKGIMKHSFEYLDRLLSKASDRGIEVVMFTNPIRNDLLNLFYNHGLKVQIEEWKSELEKRGKLIDLLYYRPERQQSFFFDPAHINFSHSHLVVDEVL